MQSLICLFKILISYGFARFCRDECSPPRDILISPSRDKWGTKNSGKHLQMHGKCGNQKKGRENTLT